jgi:signal transduction histidine kinase
MTPPPNNTMPDNPVISSLDQLKRALDQLDGQSIPPETLTSIQEARHALEVYARSGEGHPVQNRPIEPGEFIQQLNELRYRYVSLISHELRTPMTTIRGYTELMTQGIVGPITEQQHEFLKIIRNNVDRMAALVSNLSDITRIETGRLQLKPAYVQLQVAVKEALKSLRSTIDEKHLELSIDIPDDLAPAYVDPDRLQQILANLLHNAWKYTPAAGQIAIRADQQDTFIQVQVSDTGIGIGYEDQDQLFVQFFRSEDPRVRQVNGWGLSLHVTKCLVEAMGGAIDFTSTPEEGSIFRLTLPTHGIA